MKGFRILLILVLAGCASTPKESTLNPNDYYNQVQDALEFATLPGQTQEFFAQIRQGTTGMNPDRFFDVLGENVSSAVLMLEAPYKEQISLAVNENREMFVKALDQRISRGGSVVGTQDVGNMTVEDEFLKIRINSPGIVTGFVYILKDPIEGRTTAEQTFVNFYLPRQEPRKLSISALIRLLKQ